jgi:EmrB/QacA subfamily drug resistance transporter
VISVVAIKPPCDAGVVQSTPAAAPCTRATEAWVLAASILGTSMSFVDGTVVNLALPALERSLGATVSDAQWVVESYSLFLASLLLIGGALGDRMGRRRVFAWGVAVFAGSSVACGLAPNPRWLIGARALQGIGAALLVPGSLALLSATFPPERRGRAIGTWSAWSSAAAGIGPVLGGWLIEAASWRWIFWLNAPLAAGTLAIALTRVPESRSPVTAKRLDWPGAALATAGLGGLVYGLIEAPRAGLGSAGSLVPVAAGVALLAGFVFVERIVPEPMVPLDLFRSRTFVGANLLTLFLYSAMGSAFFFLPFALIQVHHYTATEAGGAMLPLIVFMFLLSPWAGGLVDRYGARLPLVVGPLLVAGAYALLALVGTRGSYWTTFFPGITALGLGMTVSVAPLTTTVMDAAPTARAGAASGINNAVSRTAGVLAIAVFGLLATSHFNRALDRRLHALQVPAQYQAALADERNRLAGAEIPPSIPPGPRATLRQAIDEAFMEAFRVLMMIAAGLAVAAAASAWALIGPSPGGDQGVGGAR